ncbi:MAG: hypothetical protein ACK5UJ_03535, partial [Pseudobdellovibrionaceae bacterium]
MFILLFLLGLSFPYWILIFKIGTLESVDSAELLWVLKNTALQAVGSSLVALSLGFLMSFGVPALENRWRPLLSAGLIFPFFVPSLYVIALWVAHAGWMGVGNLTVVMVQGLIASGYVALRLREIFESQLVPYATVAATLGSSRLFFFRKALGIVKRDILSLFFFVMVVAATSFAIPLVLGGTSGSNLEVLIYEKIRISFAWDEALLLSLCQLSVILLFSVLQKKYSG